MTRLTTLRGLATLAVLGLALPAAADEKKPEKRPDVEVVFCIDTTGSMSGLIKAAKDKVWSISNQIASGKPTPNLKIGLIAYRDKKDAYVTQVTDLTADLDAVYAKLKTFQAQGGNDTPEHVNQALHDAVHKVKWSDDSKALKIIFLVGDAPPHMDYVDDVKYPETCKEAVKKGIIINSIQCGGNAECAKAWRDVCAKAEGSYVQIAQSGGVVVVATPFDKDLAKINAALADTTLAYGSRRKQMEATSKAESAKALPGPASADRAAFAGRSGKAVTGDLIDAIKNKKVKLTELKTAELPEELRKLDPTQRKEYIDKVEKKREELRKQAVELDKKRQDFIKKKLAEDAKANKGKDGFDSQVLQMLRKQAKKHNIDY